MGNASLLVSLNLLLVFHTITWTWTIHIRIPVDMNMNSGTTTGADMAQCPHLEPDQPLSAARRAMVILVAPMVSGAQTALPCLPPKLTTCLQSKKSLCPAPAAE